MMGDRVHTGFCVKKVKVATLIAKSILSQLLYQEDIKSSDFKGGMGMATVKTSYKNATKLPEKHKNRDLFSSYVMDYQ